MEGEKEKKVSLRVWYQGVQQVCPSPRWAFLPMIRVGEGGWRRIYEERDGGERRREERSDSIYVSTMRLCLAKLSYMNLYT